jgi:Tfp pilus assembly protein PilN
MARRRIETDSDLLAVCRRRDGDGEDLRVLLVRGDRSIVDRFTCRSSELSDRLSAVACGRVLAVLPGAATLVRTIHVPPSGQLQVESAIRLEAEARLLGSAPRHRTGIGVIGGDGPHPTGIVVAWPDGLPGGIAPLESTATSDLEIERVPEIACLAHLAGDSPDGLVASLDGHGRSRTLSAVIPTSAGPVFRSSRGGDGDLVTRLRPLVVETLLADGIDPTEIQPAAERVLRSAESGVIGDVLVIGSHGESALMDAHGTLPDASDPHAAEDRVLLAAIDIRLGRLAALARLRAEEVFEEPGVLRRLTLGLSGSRTAVAIFFAAILMLVLAPLGSAGLRLMLMRTKVGDLAALEAKVRETDNRQKIYRELDRQAWSVTKLLGDVANLMPEQIETTSISLSYGDPMTVSGLAKRDGDLNGTDAVFEFNRRLRESGLFADAGPMPSIDPPDARGYSEFKISAELADPLRPLRTPAEEDYAILSFSDRRFGPVDDDGFLIVDAEKKQARIDALIKRGLAFEQTLPEVKAEGDPNAAGSDDPTTLTTIGDESSEPAIAAVDGAAAASGDVARTDADRPSRTTRPATPSRATGDRGSARGGDEPASRGAIRTNVIEVPPPISAEEIAVMSNAEAKDRLSKVSKGRQAPGLSEEDIARLKSEFDLLMQRLRETSDQ